MESRVPSHETFKVAALLALVGGFLDAYTYLLRGGVFANAQTGNMVLLAIALAQGEWGQAGYYIIPITAFAAGVFVTNLFRKVFHKREILIFEHSVLLFEVGLLFFIGFLPPEVPDGIVNVTVSFICSLQVNTFRKVRGSAYASTMCTGNLRSGTEQLFLFLTEGNRRAGQNALRYTGIIAMFIAGAASGAVLVAMLGLRSIWLCCVILLMISCLMLHQEKRIR